MNAGTLSGNSGKAAVVRAGNKRREWEREWQRAKERERERRRKEKGIQPTSGGQQASAQEIKLMSWNRDSDHTNLHRTHSRNKIMPFMYEHLYVKSVKSPFYTLTHISPPFSHAYVDTLYIICSLYLWSWWETDSVLRTNFLIQLNLEMPEEIQSPTGQRSQQHKCITTNISHTWG